MTMLSKASSHVAIIFRSFRVKWVCLLLLFLALLSLIVHFGFNIKRIPCIQAYNARLDPVQQHRIDALKQVAAASRAAARKAPNVYFPSAEDLARPTAWPAVPGVLSSGAGDIPIMTYGTTDKYISNNILRLHCWEDSIRKHMIRLMQPDKNIGLIDLGCNIGVYALTAAKHGRKVVAVDANRYNLLMLGRSLLMNAGMKERVVMVHNALSNEYGRVHISIVPHNIGGSGVSKMSSTKEKALNLKNEAESILMDDLLSILPFRRAVIKIDIESFEHFAFAGAELLFEKIDVIAVFMEWSGQRDDVDKNRGAWTMEFIYRFFTSKGYKPYTAESGWALSFSYCLWANNIVWKRVSG